MGALLYLATLTAALGAGTPLTLPPPPSADVPGALRVVGPDAPWGTQVVPGADGTATFDGRGGRQVAAAPAYGPPNSDWRIVRVGGGTLAEPEFAALLRDPALAQRIAAGRRRHQAAWLGGMGGLGLAATGVGAYYAGWGSLPGSGGRRDARALGASLIAVGVTSAVLGVLFPILRPPHVLARGEAEALCESYNGQLPHPPAAARPES